MVKLFPKNSNLCDHNPPTSRTDGQTRHVICKTAFCTKVHCAVKTKVAYRLQLDQRMSFNNNDNNVNVYSAVVMAKPLEEFTRFIESDCQLSDLFIHLCNLPVLLVYDCCVRYMALLLLFSLFICL